jgi:hypothetical protein
LLEPVRERLPANCRGSSKKCCESASNYYQVHEETPPPAVDFYVLVYLGML